MPHLKNEIWREFIRSDTSLFRRSCEYSVISLSTLGIECKLRQVASIKVQLLLDQLSDLADQVWHAWMNANFAFFGRGKFVKNISCMITARNDPTKSNKKYFLWQASTGKLKTFESKYL